MGTQNLNKSLMSAIVQYTKNCTSDITLIFLIFGNIGSRQFVSATETINKQISIDHVFSVIITLNANRKNTSIMMYNEF